jgi:hypothetical protein
MRIDNKAGAGGAVDWDSALSTLASTRRRHLLGALADSGGDADLDDLSRQILAWEATGTIDDVSEETVQQVSTTLYHAHVPALVDDGFVEWVADRGRVRLTERALAHPVLLPLARWSRYPALGPTAHGTPVSSD